MRLYVINVARVDTGIAIGPAQHICLSIGVGCQHAVGSAVMIDRAAGDDGEDIVAVPARVIEALQHQHARTLRTCVTVGVGGKGLDSTVRREHSSDLVESECDGRGHERVNSAGNNDISLTGSQGRDALVHRDKR